MAVFMPTTLPARSTRGPPELPGLIAASVWMKCWNWLCETPVGLGSSVERFLPEMMPAVTVFERLKGRPRARTQPPTCAQSEVPRVTAAQGHRQLALTDETV